MWKPTQSWQPLLYQLGEIVLLTFFLQGDIALQWGKSLRIGIQTPHNVHPPSISCNKIFVFILWCAVNFLRMKFFNHQYISLLSLACWKPMFTLIIIHVSKYTPKKKREKERSHTFYFWVWHICKTCNSFVSKVAKSATFEKQKKKSMQVNTHQWMLAYESALSSFHKYGTFDHNLRSP